MRLVVVMCAGEHLEEVRRIVDEHEVQGYTEIPDIPGSGATGRRMGTRAWPGTSSIIFTAVPDEMASRLIDDLEAYRARCSPGEGIRAMVLPIDRMI